MWRIDNWDRQGVMIAWRAGLSTQPVPVPISNALAAEQAASQMSTSLPIVVALTGASGAAYGKRLVEVLLEAGRNVHLTISPAAKQVFETELDLPLNVDQFDPSVFDLSDEARERLSYWHFRDFTAGMASGSFRTAGMAICPCSMGTLAAVAHGMSQNLIHRAADVHLKERRKLVLVPRETPLGVIQLENMKLVAAAGAVVMPAMPGFYHKPQTIEDLVDFIVQRVCDQLGVEVRLSGRWSEK